MKSYDELSKKEKEKLDIYLKTRQIFNIRFASLLILFGIFFSAGMVLLSINSFIPFIFGVYLFLISIMITFMIYFFYENEKKFSTLVFDIQNAQEDVFDITDEDLRKMKKRWIKVK